MTKAAAGATKEAELNLTTVVTATANKWMVVSNGTTNANKFYLMGSQSTVDSATAAPKDSSAV
jgi:DNA-directed RNA polymerase specialized sigma54-like protein